MKVEDIDMTDDEVMAFINQNTWHWYRKFKAEGWYVRLEELKGLVTEKFVIAMAAFDEKNRKGAKFTSFAITCIRRGMADFRKVHLRKQERRVAYPICPVTQPRSKPDASRSGVN